MEEKKKVNIKLIIVVVVVLIAALSVGFVASNLLNKKDDVKVEEKQEKEEVKEEQKEDVEEEEEVIQPKLTKDDIKIEYSYEVATPPGNLSGDRNIVYATISVKDKMVKKIIVETLTLDTVNVLNTFTNKITSDDIKIVTTDQDYIIIEYETPDAWQDLIKQVMVINENGEIIFNPYLRSSSVSYGDVKGYENGYRIIGNGIFYLNALDSDGNSDEKVPAVETRVYFKEGKALEETLETYRLRCAGQC